MARVTDPVNGVLLLDKPLGMSSNHALQRAKYALGAAKAGHTGALDPLATGMLPLCFGEATKIAGLLLGARKRYRALIVLGAGTTTDDAEGEVVATHVVTMDMLDALPGALAGFIGRIRQRAPIYSALKQQGVPLYKRARRGEEVEAPEREVEVFAIERLAIRDDIVDVEIECGSGTYIRAIARDLGVQLGCGAHLGGLERLWVEPFADAPMTTLAKLLESGQSARDTLVPIEAALAHLNAITLALEDATRFCQGQSVVVAGPPPGQPIVVFGPDGSLLGLGSQADGGLLSPTRVFNLSC